MSTPAPHNLIKQRRAELSLTQQEAARRADVSLATWRRFENATGDASALIGFRTDNFQGFARALRLSVAALRRLTTITPTDETGTNGHKDSEPDDQETIKIVSLFNRSFVGDPLTPTDAMALANTVDFSDFTPTLDGRLHLDSSFSYDFSAYLKGESTIRDVGLLRDLPELALIQVTNHWLVRMGERIMRIGSEISKGCVPHPQCLADEYALWVVIKNTEAPQIDDVTELFPGLRTNLDVFNYDPDSDDTECDSEIQIEWMDRIAGGLIPSHRGQDYRRYDLQIMETFGQGIYDPKDPRHPIRWFDRDDLRERCLSELEFAKLPEDKKYKDY